MPSAIGRKLVFLTAFCVSLCLPPTRAALTPPGRISVHGGPLGQIELEGILSGLGFWQDNPQGEPGTFGAKRGGSAISNGSLIVAKRTGLIEFHIQAGVYSFPTLAGDLTEADPSNTIHDFGAIPIAYLKIVPNSHVSFLAGKLPTLIGAESGWTWQNFNIERGLLWNMEPIISRGIQVNVSEGVIHEAFSWNDGYYSNRYNVVSDLLSYTIDRADSLAFYAEAPLGRVPAQSQDPVYNPYGNASQLYGLIYESELGPWTLEPYIQYMITPKSVRLGIARSFSNYGGAFLVNYAFDHDFSLAGRLEYLRVGGAPGESLSGVAGALTDFPEDSHAWSVTVTPTWQVGDVFARLELSYVTATTPTGTGLVGARGQATAQWRTLFEAGVLF